MLLSANGLLEGAATSGMRGHAVPLFWHLPHLCSAVAVVTRTVLSVSAKLRARSVQGHAVRGEAQEERVASEVVLAF